MSNQSINLKDYEIVYNNGTSDAVWPLENDIVLAPGESAVIWRVLQTVLNTGVDDDSFIDYWKKQTSNADLNLVRGKKFTRSVCNGLANSGERSMVIRAKVTREVLTMVAYNGKGNIEANQSITFTYTDGTEGAISNYTAAPTPGSTEDGQVTGTYNLYERPCPCSYCGSCAVCQRSMLLIDEVNELIPGQRITATFWVDPAREIFKGHCPGAPVLPGVYTMEATAQATDLVLMTKPAYADKVPLFLGINNVKFRKKILPGDTLEIHAELLSERAKKAIATCKCAVYTAGDLAAETGVTIAMR